MELHPRRRNAGFTALETFAVLVIVAILAALVIPRVMERPDEARVRKAKADLLLLQEALNRYKTDNGRYPATGQGLEALVARPSEAPEPTNWRGPYLQQVPKDPWNRHYQYQSPGKQSPIDVYTLGADGHPGGEGVDTDIGNWSLEHGGAN